MTQLPPLPPSLKGGGVVNYEIFSISTILETGLSDFHLLLVTEFTMGFTKFNPRIITYRHYKKFNNNEIQNPCPCEADLGFFRLYFSHFQ